MGAGVVRVRMVRGNESIRLIVPVEMSSVFFSCLSSVCINVRFRTLDQCSTFIGGL